MKIVHLQAQGHRLLLTYHDFLCDFGIPHSSLAALLPTITWRDRIMAISNDDVVGVFFRLKL